MLFYSIRMQMAVLSRKKGMIIMYLAMLALVVVNYGSNIINYYGKDLVAMYHPMKLTLLNDYGGYGFLLMQYFPILVVIPAAFSYMSDRDSREIVFIQLKVGRGNYYWGKYISVFLITFLVFTIPPLVEIVLNCIAFPLSATGDPSNSDMYDVGYIESIGRYFLPLLWLRHPYAYTVLFTIIFGAVSGVLAGFALAISTLPFMRFKVYVFVPVYLLMDIIGRVGSLRTDITFSTSYFDYLRMLSSSHKSGVAYFALMVGIVIVSVLLLRYKSGKDELL